MNWKSEWKRKRSNQTKFHYTEDNFKWFTVLLSLTASDSFAISIDENNGSQHQIVCVSRTRADNSSHSMSKSFQDLVIRHCAQFTFTSTSVQCTHCVPKAPFIDRFRLQVSLWLDASPIKKKSYCRILLICNDPPLKHLHVTQHWHRAFHRMWANSVTDDARCLLTGPIRNQSTPLVWCPLLGWYDVCLAYIRWPYSTYLSLFL